MLSGNMKDIALVPENIVYMEMLRQGYTVTAGKKIHFACGDKGNKLYVPGACLPTLEDTLWQAPYALPFYEFSD